MDFIQRSSENKPIPKSQSLPVSPLQSPPQSPPTVAPIHKMIKVMLPNSEGSIMLEMKEGMTLTNVLEIICHKR